MEGHGEEAHKTSKSNTNKVVIQIPSYQEVIDSSQNPKTLSLFKPSQTFSQAFSSIKNSEFYTPPPQHSGDVSGNVSGNSTPSPSPSPAPPPTTQSVPSTSQPVNVTCQIRNSILVSHRQKGNPLLKHIRNVKWAFADVVCDYLLGQTSCALYLSLRYHLLHPDYLYYRIRELQKNYKLRVVLCHVDVEDVVKPLLEVTKTVLLHDCTLLCAWSLEECGRYLETIKMYENKPADLIQGQMDTDYSSRLSHALTTVRHVNKTDVVTLGSTFGSLSNIMDASMEDLARCPGIGERKVKRLYDTFHEPFKRVVRSQPVVTETSEKVMEPSSASEVTEVEKGEEESKRKKRKDPELTVKSALSAAFLKYADKFGEKTKKSEGKDSGETSLPLESGTDSRNPDEGAGS